MTAAWLGIYATMFGSTAAARVADDLVYPDYRDEPLEPPLYIIACPRSGTTLLHELLALDSERFTHFKLYQTLVPAVSAYRFARKLADTVGRDRADRVVRAIDDWAFAGWQGIHPTGLTKSEEDEQLFVYPFLSPAIYFIFPWIRRLPELRFIDDLPDEARSRAAEYYRDSIRRHVFATGGHRTMIVKNVHAASRLSIIRQAFPDARFVHLVRHPYEAVASSTSMFIVTWQMPAPEIPRDSPEARDYAQLYIDYYRYLHDETQKMPEDSVLTMPYRDLVSDPVRAVESIYSKFGYELGDSYRQRLERAVGERKKHKSQHHYSLAEFGLTEDYVYDQLRPCFDAYGFER